MTKPNPSTHHSKKSSSGTLKTGGLFLEKTFDTLLRELIRKHNGGQNLKLEFGVNTQLRRVVEKRCVTYLKAARREMVIHKNKTLLMSHLESVAAIRGEHFLCKGGGSK